MADSLEWPLDVRFEDGDTVLLAAGRSGVYSLDLATPAAEPKPVVPADQVTFASRLALSEKWLVTGTTFGPVGWKARIGNAVYREDAAMSTIVDLDAVGDEVWVLGARRDSDGAWAPDGAILWSFKVTGSGLLEAHPLMFAGSGPGAQEMSRCSLFETGAVRSAEDGRRFVVPGIQPGAFLYGPDGKLIRAWQTEKLGFVDGCTLSEEESVRFSADPHARNQWLRGRTVVDDAVFWQGAPAVIIRRSVEGSPRWTLLQLLDGDSVRRVPLPIRGAGPNARLRADVQGKRMVVLITEYEVALKDRKEAPKLVVLEAAQE